MRCVRYIASEEGMVPAVEELLSKEVAELFGRHLVRLESVDPDGLVELGFSLSSRFTVDNCEIWTRRVPDIAGPVMHLAVFVPRDPSFSRFLYGIVEAPAFDSGWYGEDFCDFCLTAHGGGPRGESCNDEAILFIDDLVRRMLSIGAIVPTGVGP